MSAPQYSPDGKWWWNGQEWIPVPPSAPPQVPQQQSIWTMPMSQWHPALRAIVTVPLIILILGVIFALLSLGSR